jgi:hypothetical protein
MLRQVQPPLATPNLLKLLRRQLALCQQEVTDVFPGCFLIRTH